MLERIKRNQYLLLWAVIVVVSIAFVITLSLLLSSKTLNQNLKKPVKKSLTTGTSRINPQEAWVHDFSARAELTQKRLETLEQMIDKVLKSNIAAESNLAPKPMVTPAQNLRKDIASVVEHPVNTQTSENMQHLPMQPNNNLATLSNTASQRNLFKSKELKKISLNLHRGRQQKPLKTTDNIIPAGAFAEARLLGGVDASTSIQASADPRPILLRLTNPGTLPRKFKSDLDGCHVLAACYGDISSERVFMRLEKLSCVERKTGEVMEMNVQGYVAGEDGRAGIRGQLVDRAGASMRNAMIGGFFGSIGKFLGQAKNPLIFSPNTGLVEQSPLSGNDILKQSAGNGMSGALDKYADFYIKRAEQMQPVIQVAAGRLVDIVFTQGFDFSDSALRQMLSKTNDQKRFQQMQSLEETKSVQEWLPKNQGEQE